ncbi:MAG TPA: DUF692 domain-containing protein [Pirellulales bacterium]|nr:DUF692 domain-containing protein [Pirellulales bacterium]
MTAARLGYPNLGLGVGLRTVHFHHILEHQPEVDWFEIISENFMDSQGRPRYVLDQIAERYPIVMHGVSLSIGSTDPLDFDYLTRLKRLADDIQPQWISDHLCWTGVLGLNAHDLLPIPLNEQTLQHVVDRIRIVQDFLERPLIVENPSSYITFASSTISEWDFLSQMAEQADCGLLLDVNNVYVSSANHDFDPVEYVDHVPHRRIVQCHLAGHTNCATHLIDTHDNHVIDPVWELFRRVHAATGGVSALLEWDANIPPFPVVHAEVLKARQYFAAKAPLDRNPSARAANNQASPLAPAHAVPHPLHLVSREVQ